MKKYYCLIIACISLLSAGAQNHTDTLQFLYKKKDFNQGLNYCQKHNIAENGYGKDLYYAGLIYHEANRICESYRLLEKAMNSFTLSKKEGKKANKIIQTYKVLYDSATYFYSKAYDAHQDKKFIEAQHYLDKVLQNDAHFIDALQFRLILAVEFENEKEIEQYFALIKSENPYFTKCYKTVGTYYVDKEKFEKALLVYNDLVKLDEASGNFNLGITLYGLKEYEKAIEYYRKSFALDHDKAAFFNIGLCYTSQKKHDLALQTFMNLKKGGYDNGRVNERIAECYYQLDNYEKAIEHYRLAIIDEPTKAKNFYRLGVCLHHRDIPDFTVEKRISQNEEAFANIIRAIQLDSTVDEYFSYAATSLVFAGRTKEAYPFCLKAIKLDSTDFDNWDRYFRLCVSEDCTNNKKRKMALEGISCYKKFLKDNPKNAYLNYGLAICYRWYSDACYENNKRPQYTDSTITFLYKAIALDSTERAYYYELAFTYSFSPNKIQQDAAIEKNLKNWLSHFPNDEEALSDLFWYYENKKDYKNANDYFILINQKSPKHWRTQQVNDNVWDLRKKYKWSNICERQECFYLNKR